LRVDRGEQCLVGPTAPRSSFPAPASLRRLLTFRSRLFRRPFVGISVGSSSFVEGLTTDSG
jgi:hypothetical protein